MQLRMFGSLIKLNPVGVVVLMGASFYFIYLYIDSYTYQNDDTVSLKRLLVLSIAATESGGREVLNARGQSNFEVKSKGKTKEGANNPLTTGDVLSNRAILQILLSEYPKLQVISEEQENLEIKPIKLSKSLNSQIDGIITETVNVPINDVTVWIDPLDATQEYTENLMEFVTTMVCVAVKGEPVIGVIHQPSLNRTVWAWNGHGISPNLKVTSADDSKKKTIIVSRSHAGRVRDVTKKVFFEDVVIKPAGGAGYKVLEVIAGNASAYIHVTLIKKWDICAGNALLNAVGGKMTTLGGATISYGRNDAVENSDGLLATKDNHGMYLLKLTRAAIS